MRRMLSLVLALVMCWSMVYVLVPAKEASAVETGNATLTGERYTVDWTIPEIGNADMTTAGSPGVGTAIEDLTYEVLGYVSPKYPDNRATNYSEDGVGELVDGTKGTNHYLNDPWVGLYGNEKNAVLIDLGAFYTNISDVTLNLLSDPELGIFLPSKITVASSADGVTFNHVGVVNTMSGHAPGVTIDSIMYSVPTEYLSVIYDATYSPNNSLFKGQYILLVFEHEAGEDGFDRFWTFISEISVKTSGDIVVDDFTGVGAMELYQKPTDADAYDVNVALNSSYQIIGSVGSGKFADTGRIELTDGIYKDDTDINTSADYVSISPADGSFGIQLDLGMSTKNITSIALSGLGGGSSSFVVPTSVALYASNDRETFYSVGLGTIATDATGTVYTISYDVTDNKAFTARYITLIVFADGDVLLDEVIIKTTNESEVIKNVALDGQYKYLLKTASSAFNDDYWAGSKNTNELPVLNTYSTGDLNNGISATGSFLDPAWVGYNYSGAASDYVDIVFDLGEEVEGINNVSFKLLEYTNSTTITASSVPESFTVFYSNTADSFNAKASVIGNVGADEYDTLVVNTTENRRQVYYNYEATLNDVTARYVMVRIPKAKKELHIDEIKICTGNIAPQPEVEGDYATLNYDIISGVWLDIFNITDLYLVQGTYQADEQTYRIRLNNYLTAMVEGGINTVMIHTRAHGDALYGDYTFDSMSPVSKRYTGSLYAVSTYDAFEIFIEEAHKVGISVHAWINPLRIGYASDLNTYDNKYDIKKFYIGNYNGVERSDYVGMSSDNLYWLNIGYESVRQHIVNSVLEIVNNYDVDAIIMDDYFYPAGATTDFDAECYAELGAGEDLGSWRRENTNLLVRALYKHIKLAKSDVLFGISPAGNVENYENSYNYSTMYADVRKWCQQTWSDGTNTYLYMDYISPQLYWAPDEQFATVTQYGSWWNKNYVIGGYLGDWMNFNFVNTSTTFNNKGVKLVVSLGAYRNFDTTIDNAYYKDNVIFNQLELMRQYLLDKDGVREFNPVNASGQGLGLVYGQILYNSHSLYDKFDIDVTKDNSGWATSEAFGLQKSLDVRNELLAYWQGDLKTGWDGSEN
ncbi:MAG: hypothetical protein E7597_00230 [Ruminococcaceae bacterium]|nr:hypothetical protein [Oscillospiraceae bacterium]